MYYIEKVEDLMSCGSFWSLAHCASQDLHMGKGIATHFRRLFGGIHELVAQKGCVGSCIVLHRQNRYIFYLITKKKYYGKPSYTALESSLVALKRQCIENGIKYLAMPKIGCGLDGLNWQKVKSMIIRIFQGTDITLKICMQ